MLHSFYKAIPCLLPCNGVFKVLWERGRMLLSINQKVMSTVEHPFLSAVSTQCPDITWLGQGVLHMGFLSPSSMANFGYGENGLKNKVCPLLWNGIWRKRCGQLLNGGLKIYRSTSVSVWRSQWTDLSPRWAGARRKRWSEWWGRSHQNRGKRTPGNLCSEFWLWDKKQLCKNGSLWRELWYFLRSNSWILNTVMNFYRTLTFIHSWNKTSCSLEGEGGSVRREKSHVQGKARRVGGGGGGGAVKHTV